MLVFELLVSCSFLIERFCVDEEVADCCFKLVSCDVEGVVGSWGKVSIREVYVDSDVSECYSSFDFAVEVADFAS